MKRRNLWTMVLLALVSAPALAEETPYVYQRGAADTGRGVVEWETAVGTREARPFGDRGVEQAVRAELRSGQVGVSARVGALFADDVYVGALVEGQVGARARAWDFTVAAGGGVDYRGDAVLRFRGQAGYTAGRLHVVAGGFAEVPLTGERDAVDLVIGAGASVRAGRVRVGAEALAEDVEGLWEEEEAEGGMRLLAGPTLAVAASRRVEVRANAAVFVPVAGGDAGFLGRLVVGASF